MTVMSTSSPWARASVGRLRGNLGFVAVATGACLIVIVLLAAPILPLADPSAQDLSSALNPPSVSGAHLLGTDELGRDVLARVVYGGRLSLAISGCAAAGSLVIGMLLALLAGSFGGWVDIVVSRLIDAQLSIPYILLALGIVAVQGRSIVTLTFVLGLIGWAPAARVLRSRVLTVRALPFIDTLQMAGMRSPRIVARHVLPNMAALALTLFTLQISEFILFESALSFLGLGVADPQVSWGLMLADSEKYIQVAWWPTVFPGLAIVMLVVTVSSLGDRVGKYYV